MEKSNIYQIGVMGSTPLEMSAELEIKVRTIGREIAERGHVLVTGGGTRGVPFAAAQSAKSAGGKVVAIVPGFNPNTFRSKNSKDSDIFDAIIQTGLSSSPLENNSLGLDFLNVNSSDALIFIGGSLGTLAEFAIALKADKVIGILDASGGMSTYFADIVRDTGKEIIIEKEPGVLLEKLLEELT